MNVKFIKLTSLPAWDSAKAEKWNGLFIDVTEGTGKGLYFGQDAWVKLDNVAQNTASEIHSASIDNDGLVSFYNNDNETGTALFTLALAKVAKTGELDAKSVKLSAYNNSDGSDIAEGTTVQAAIEALIESVDATNVAAAQELAKKVDKVEGMGLSHNDLTDTLKTGYDNAAAKAHEHTNATVLDGITEDKVNAWDAKQDAIAENTYDAYGAADGVKTALEGTADDTKDSATIVGAKKYADSLVKDADGNSLFDAAGAAAAVQGETTETVASVDAKVKAIDNHTHANKDVLDNINATRTATWDNKVGDVSTGSANGTVSVDGKDVAVKGLGSAAYTESTAYDAAGTGAAAAKAVQGETNETVKSLADKLETINGDGEGSIKKAVADGIADVVAGADSDFDTLKEVADWINNDKTGAAALQAASHTHYNKTVLDGITAEKVASWDGAVNAAGVSSVGGKAGAITLKGDSTTAGDINLTISEGGQISAAIVDGKYDAAGAAAAVQGSTTETVASLATKKQDALANAEEVAKIADGDVAKWNAKQDAIAENTYDAYGAASAVQGSTTETVASLATKKQDTLTAEQIAAFEADSITTLSGDAANAYENSGVNVVVKVAETKNDDDYAYTVNATAEMVWLTTLPE